MLKAAVIGCGRMGAEPASRLEGAIPAGWLPMSHAEVLQQTEGVQLAALADRDRARLERHGAHYGVRSLYTDYRHLLEEVRPDIVTIATRTPGKADILRSACAAGAKAIYVEKPLANSLRECREALAAAAAAGTVVAYGVNRRYHAAYRKARELIREGEIGEILDVCLEFGRSQLLWAHPHGADLALFFLGADALVDVQATLSEETVNRQGARRVDSDPVVESACFRFGSGARCMITRLGGCNVRIGGSHGSLTVHADGAYIEICRAASSLPAYCLQRRLLHVSAPASATMTAFGEMVRAVRKRDAAPIPALDIEGGMAMLIGCVWSHLEGNRPVPAADIPADLVVTGRYGDAYA